ncbi:MAG TPA: sulfate permease [Streptosporangiaceae bacterium]|nr:sulfate permease [Streptosporangiaceae bacterium]
MRRLAMLRGYQRSWLRGDLIGGVTVAAYLVPQVMAYATVAGLHPVAGLWAALPALVIYALLGSSPSLSMGPEATTALMTAIAIGPLAAADSARYAELAATLALLVGVMGIAAWLLRLGFVADLLSRPVLIGYMAGVALIMIAGQLGRVTGVQVSGEEFISQLRSFARGVSTAQPAVIVVAAAVLAFLVLLRWQWRNLPGPLLAVLLATAVVAAFSLHRHGVAVVGPIPAGFPAPHLPALHPAVLRMLLLPAFSVLIVGFSDDVLTGRSFARRGEIINANRELLALGVGNVGAGLVRGFPVSSSATRTAIAVTSGSRSQVYSIATAVTVVVVLLAARPVLARFPTAALGAIVIYAALRLVDITAFQRLFRFRRAELAIAIAACAGVLVFNILYGVLVAIGLSVADLLVRVARPHDAIQGLVPGLAGMHDVDDYPEARTVPGLVVYRYDAPLFFANAEDFRRRALAAADQQRAPLRWFVLNVEANVEVDFTALEAMDAIRDEITRRGAVFALARVKHDLLARLQAFGIADKIGADRLYPTLPTAVDAFHQWARQHPADNSPPATGDP